jgi:hypothetical protein
MVSEAFERVMLKDYIKWPSAEKLLTTASVFETKCTIPNIAGAIDGTHISIVRPREQGNDYYNRKSYYSINVQAVVDENTRFMSVTIGWPGSVGDARIWNNCKLEKTIEEKLSVVNDRNVMTNSGYLPIPMFILGDAAYPNTKRMVTTFQITEVFTTIMANREKFHGKSREFTVNLPANTQVRKSKVIKELNNRLANVRSVVERAFGAQMARWRILCAPLQSSRNLRRTISIITSLMILHNFMIDQHDKYVPTDMDLQAINLYRDKYPIPRDEDYENEEESIRAAIMNSKTKAGREKAAKGLTRDKLMKYIEYRQNARTIREADELARDVGVTVC